MTVAGHLSLAPVIRSTSGVATMLDLGSITDRAHSEKRGNASEGVGK